MEESKSEERSIEFRADYVGTLKIMENLVSSVNVLSCLLFVLVLSTQKVSRMLEK